MKFRWTLTGATRLSMAAILATSGIGLLAGCGGTPPQPEEGEIAPMEDIADPLTGDPAAVEGEDTAGAGDPAAGADPAAP
jgi:hypothetical protein